MRYLLAAASAGLTIAFVELFVWKTKRQANERIRQILEESKEVRDQLRSDLEKDDLADLGIEFPESQLRLISIADLFAHWRIIYIASVIAICVFIAYLLPGGT